MSNHIQFLIDALSDPTVYPHPVQNVDVIQTHISVVFIAGDFVYKIKKPLNMGFLDYTTLDKRRFFCQQEVTLNSRFSEGIYLEVVEIYSRNSQVNFSGLGELMEVAVLMKRIPENRVLKRMLLNDEIEDSHLVALAKRLKEFHADATQSGSISLFGAPEVIHQNLTENFEQVRNYVGVCLEAELLDEITSGSFEFLGHYLPDFKSRVKKGLIRDLHGDLHSEHIVFLDRIMLVDCIEFNDRFRYSDIVSDLAFLLMDLDFLGFPALSRKLRRYYSENEDNSFVKGLYRFYKSYRAFVRGKVNSFALSEPEISESSRNLARQSATDYFRLSAWYLRNRQVPFLMVTCGLMGSGKSFLAQKISGRTDAVIIRSDVIRKQMLGIGTSERHFDDFGRGIYTSDVTNETYTRMFELASDQLKQGFPVILDASFSSFRHRDIARKVALDNGARFSILEVTAPDDVIKARLSQRALLSKEPSDGRWELFHEQKSRFEPPKPEESERLNVYDSSKHSEQELGKVVRKILFF